MRAFLGPAMLVSVGYMDPGNWATDLEGGARFGYQLLWVLLASNVIAWLLQTLCVRLGTVSGLDLASACRSYYSPFTARWLWILAELAIVGCDLAEVLGSAVALNLLFGVPLVVGALLTAADVLVVLGLGRGSTRLVERWVGGWLLLLAICLATEVVLARPVFSELASGFVPHLDGESLYLAIGILGATVMPHNLYLHSALGPRHDAGAPRSELARSLRLGAFSTALALNTAFFFNAAILVLSAATFFSRDILVTDLGEAHSLLSPLLGTGAASLLFALGLLGSGQSSTVSGTMAGQIVMEGFVNLRVSPALRRAITRGLALLPAVAVLALAGSSGTLPLLVASQVVLSLQLPFAIIPLLRFTSSRGIMGSYANRRPARWGAVACAVLVISANTALVIRLAHSWSAEHPALTWLLVGLGLLGLLGLFWISWVPLRRPLRLVPDALLDSSSSRDGSTPR